MRDAERWREYLGWDAYQVEFIRAIQADAVLLSAQGSIWRLVCRAPCDQDADDPKAIDWHFEHCEYANALSPADPKPMTEEE